MTAAQPATVEELFEQLAPSLYAMAMAVTRSSVEAEDLVQEGLLRFWQAHQAGRVADPKRENYLNRLSANLRKTWWRKRKRWLWLEESPQPVAGNEPDPSDIADERDRDQALSAAFWSLKAEDRMVLSLHRVLKDSDSEVAAATGWTAETVRQKDLRARGRLGDAWIHGKWPALALPAVCRLQRLRLLEDRAGNLAAPLQAPLREHVDCCSACSILDTKLARYVEETGGLPALAPFFVPSGRARERMRARLVAAVAHEDRERRPRVVLPRLLWWVPLLLLLMAPAPLVRYVIRQPAADVLPLPSPIAALPPATPTPGRPAPQPSLTPPTPCPVAWSGGFAYLDRGELYYRSSIAAVTQRLTATGGRVDNFWWSPDGSRIAYKVSAAPPDLAGDVHVLSIASRAELWHYGTAVDSFAFSPEGARYAVVRRVITNGNWDHEFIAVGSLSKPPSQGDSWQLNLPALPYNPRAFQETQAKPAAMVDPQTAVFWTGASVYFNLPDLYYRIDPANGPVPGGSGLDSATQEDTWLSLPTTGPLVWNLETSDLVRSCQGRSQTQSWVLLGGRPAWVSVSRDGSGGLVSVDQGFASGLILLSPGGSLVQLGADGTTTLGKWRP